MAWSFLKRLFGPPAPKIVLGGVESADFSPAGASRNDPQARARARELEEEFRRELEGSHDPAELRARTERFEREHGMKEIASEQIVIAPDAATAKREGEEGIRRKFEELDRELAGVDDPEELKARTERFAREHGWRIVSEVSDPDAANS